MTNVELPLALSILYNQTTFTFLMRNLLEGSRLASVRSNLLAQREIVGEGKRSDLE